MRQETCGEGRELVGEAGGVWEEKGGAGGMWGKRGEIVGRQEACGGGVRRH